MASRGIIFSAPMVRRILAGQKTQTRRIVKPQPVERAVTGFGEGWVWYPRGEHRERFNNPCSASELAAAMPNLCRYGAPGDRLWVRETFQPIWAEGRERAPCMTSPDGWALNYVADGAIEYRDPDRGLTTRATPAIHMPRWASRIHLEITGVRVERLRSITELDAIAEGARHFGDIPDRNPYKQGNRWSMFEPAGTDECLGTPRFAFGNAWNAINGDGAWDANPWVWAIAFERVEDA